MDRLRALAAACLPLWLAGCALPRPASPPMAVPAQWQAALPHGGDPARLAQWWQQLDDPLLVELLEAAQAASPTVASAKSRIEQSRAARAVAGAALLPTLDGSASASRGTGQVFAAGATPAVTSVQVGVQAAWEADLFGANRATTDAAQERYSGAQAQWHDARVSVAAETGSLYFSLRSCLRQLAVARNDAASRAETARLTGIAAQAGFQSPANAALARATAADGAALATQRAAACDLDAKALVALSGLDESELRRKLAAAPEDRLYMAAFGAPPMPADVVAQRPDVFQAEREIAAVAAEVAGADAQRYPRLSLAGFLGVGRYWVSGASVDQDAWTFGPFTLTLPLFDGGRRAANAQAQRARYDEAVALYRDRVRQAVREVEEALVRLSSTASRTEDARVATEGYRAALEAAQARYRAGFGTLLELEDVRRSALAAETALVDLQRERSVAWVTLYRAAGGGWMRPEGAAR